MQEYSPLAAAASLHLPPPVPWKATHMLSVHCSHFFRAHSFPAPTKGSEGPHGTKAVALTASTATALSSADQALTKASAKDISQSISTALLLSLSRAFSHNCCPSARTTCLLGIECFQGLVFKHQARLSCSLLGCHRCLRVLVGGILGAGLQGLGCICSRTRVCMAVEALPHVSKKLGGWAISIYLR